MTPVKCSVCQGQNLYHGRLRAAAYPAATFFFGRPALVRAAICLSCGAVNPYLSEEQLDKVKAWKSRQ